jgi:hypothetical protein
MAAKAIDLSSRYTESLGGFRYRHGVIRQAIMQGSIVSIAQNE